MLLSTPNTVTQGDGFYVSFNNVDGDIYGGDTTALVTGQMEHFYILNGDHRAAYKTLIAEGLDACLTYFAANQDKLNHRSEKLTDDRIATLELAR